MRLIRWRSLLAPLVVLLVSASIFGVDRKKNVCNVGPSYTKWIEEDVTYIINHEETEQYKQLKTNDERDQFITEFWLHRDPTPGTVENEYKEEHYRRLAYSNEHFAHNVPGWKTDRGRIYIVYGPPNTITRPHDSPAAALSPAVEDWHYSAASGKDQESREFRFVDSCSCGDYRLEPIEKIR
jgi:GWxTD domain-containing protein